jgi:hypothetical protein
MAGPGRSSPPPPRKISGLRSIVGVRYSPGPYRTVSTTYRLARGLSEQLEVGWQWPGFHHRTTTPTLRLVK